MPKLKKMATGCTLCTHKRAAEIDQAIIDGETVRVIASRFKTSKSVVDRHKTHIAETIKNAGAVTTDGLIRKVHKLESRAERLLARAEKQGDLRNQLGALRELREQVRLLGELLGRIQTAPNLNIALVQSTEWADVRTTLLQALQPFPEARIAIAAALNSLDQTTHSNQLDRVGT